MQASIRKILGKREKDEEIFFDLEELVELFVDTYVQKIILKKPINVLKISMTMVYMAFPKVYFEAIKKIKIAKLRKYIRKTTEKYQHGIKFTKKSMLLFTSAASNFLYRVIMDGKKSYDFKEYIFEKIQEISRENLHVKIIDTLKIPIIKLGPHGKKEFNLYLNLLFRKIIAKSKEIEKKNAKNGQKKDNMIRAGICTVFLEKIFEISVFDQTVPYELFNDFFADFFPDFFDQIFIKKINRMFTGVILIFAAKILKVKKKDLTLDKLREILYEFDYLS